MRKLSRRLAWVLATAVSARASALAPPGPSGAAQREIQQRVGERRGDADREKARQRRVEAHAQDAPQVADRRRDDVDARVRVVDPVDGHLMDPHPLTLGADEQLGVEEPALVGHLRQQPARGVGPDRLEAALGVGEAGAQRDAQQPVVGPRDQLALVTAHDPGAGRQPGADRHLTVAAGERRDQRRERSQVGRQIDVHVAQDVGVAGRPGRVQRPSRPLRSRCRTVARSSRGRQHAGRRSAWRPCSRCRR